MFDRIAFKKEAKSKLRNNWGVPIIMSLVTIVTSLAYERFNLHIFSENFNYSVSFDIFMCLVFFCLNGILAMAQTWVYLNIIKAPVAKKATLGIYFDGFILWQQGLLANLWCFLWTTLWTLLFIIPGIVKLYAYSQIFYIIAENPTIPIRRALKMSIAMTHGYKGDLFTMNLSFVGWILLGLLTFGIGLLWVIPYVNTSFVCAYQYLKENALRRNILSPADFNNLETPCENNC